MNIYRKSDIPSHLLKYFEPAELGLEATPDEYVAKMVEVFREVRRLLKPDGTLWCNLGDSYAADRGYQVPDSKHVDVGNRRGMKAESYGLKPKDLVGIPWMIAFALRADGWYLRSDIIWSKPNPMPESVTDRPTKAHEYLFLMAKSQKYYYDADAIREKTGNEANPNGYGGTFHDHTDDLARGQRCNQTKKLTHPLGRNKRSVWTVATQPYKEAHFATFPEKLIDPCILAGSREGDIVLDPFGGSGTTAKRSKELGRRYIHIDLSYQDIAEDRLRQKELF